jgi:hypothetical protein
MESFHNSTDMKHDDGLLLDVPIYRTNTGPKNLATIILQSSPKCVAVVKAIRRTLQNCGLSLESMLLGVVSKKSQ